MHLEPTLNSKLLFTMLILMTTNHQLQQNKVTPTSNRKSKQRCGESSQRWNSLLLKNVCYYVS